MHKVPFLIFFSLVLFGCREEIITPKTYPEYYRQIDYTIEHADYIFNTSPIAALATDGNQLVLAHQYQFFKGDSEYDVNVTYHSVSTINTANEIQSVAQEYRISQYNGSVFTDALYQNGIFHLIGGLEYEHEETFNDSKLYAQYIPAENLVKANYKFIVSNNKYLRNFVTSENNVYAIGVEGSQQFSYENVINGGSNNPFNGITTNVNKIRNFNNTLFVIDREGQLYYKTNGAGSWTAMNQGMDDLFVDVVEYQGEIIALGELDINGEINHIVRLNTSANSFSPYLSGKIPYIQNLEFFANVNLASSSFNNHNISPRFEVINGELFIYGSFVTNTVMDEANATSESYYFRDLLMHLEEDEFKILLRTTDAIRDLEYFNEKYYLLATGGGSLLSFQLDK